MCGLAGIWSSTGWRAESQAALAAMTNSITHRGPDDQGFEVFPEHGLGLGFRRLAILELSKAGHQPMQSPSGRYVILFNGEIYNWKDLRERLHRPTQEFRGHSDTEVITAAFDKWGVEGTLTHLVGMFSLAIWDRERSLLHLVRDRFGEKPLYFAVASGTLLFGSELKALRAHPAFEAEIDRSALAIYMRLGYIPSPRTIYKDVRKVPPATMLTFRASQLVSDHQYWSPEHEIERGRKDPFKGTEDDAARECESLLLATIAGEMVADVPLGAFLSGGVDSSLIVALMQAQSARPVRTFTIGFPEKNYNEAPHAKKVAEHLGTDHTELYVTPAEAMAVIPRLVDMYDEPFADVSQIPTYLVARLARQSVTVSLSGDGGDEIFGGYNRYFVGDRLNRFRMRVPKTIRAVASRTIHGIAPQKWDRAFAAVEDAFPKRWRPRAIGDRIHKLAGVLNAESQQALYLNLISLWPDAVTQNSGQSTVFPQSRLTWNNGSGFIENMMYLDSVTYLPDDILVKVDRATMSVSLEARAPFLDHRIAEFAWSLPTIFKVRNGRGKVVLRRVLDRHVPSALIERPKMGFGVPIDQWLRGPLNEWASSLLERGRLEREGFLNAAAIAEKWNQHQSGERNWQYHLWTVLMFESWLESASRSARA
jgi:asparagine synthase (glutamine-hydrolysing)